MSNKKTQNKLRLLKELEKCKNIEELFSFVKNENINMRMHTLPGASNIPPRRLEIRNVDKNLSTLDKLKMAVKMTIELTK